MCTTVALADREAFVRFNLAGKSSALPQLHLLYLDGKHTSHVRGWGGGVEGEGGGHGADWGLNLSMS